MWVYWVLLLYVLVLSSPEVAFEAKAILVAAPLIGWWVYAALKD